MKTSYVAFVGAIVLCPVQSIASQSCISAHDASAHIGEVTCVCGTVASTKFSASSRSQPTFINLDTPYPNQIFTAVIFGEDRQKFGSPETQYSGKKVCVSGPIETYKGVAEIIVHDPAQIK